MSKCERAMRWVFTINNFTYEEEELVRQLEFNDNINTVIAEEEHLEEGTPHIQGYINTKKQVYRTTVERWLGGRAFVEQAKGSEASNWKYCSKEDTVIVDKRSEKLLKTIEKKASADEKAKQILEDINDLNEQDFEAKNPHFYLTHYNLYIDHKHRKMIQNQKIWDGDLKTKNLWIWGPPGKGKSRAARIGLPLNEIFSKSYNKWWNGFNAMVHKRIIIDDWPNIESGGNVLIQHLKIWSDRYPFTAETKGGHIAIEPSYQLIITSNYSIDECFVSEEDKGAVHRRFTEILWSDKPGTLDPYLSLSI